MMTSYHKTVGIVGGGQLCKMLIQEAQKLSIPTVFIDPNIDCVASQVQGSQIIAPFDDHGAFDQLALRCDILTYELENIDVEYLAKLEKQGVSVFPSAKTLEIIRNKCIQKNFLEHHQFPIPKRMSLTSFLKDTRRSVNSFPLLLKRHCGSYDGHGNILIQSQDQLDTLLRRCHIHHEDYMVEEFVHFQKELSISVTRFKNGVKKIFPVVENIHYHSILDKTISPAPISAALKLKVEKIAIDIVDVLDGVGIFCIEFFYLGSDQLYVNEIAPRPHNSGHYSLDTCVHSQFELHLRAILDMPPVEPTCLHPSIMVNILGPTEPMEQYTLDIQDIFQDPSIKVHLYGKKTSHARRKLGHFTVVDSTEKDIPAIENLKQKIKIKRI